MAGAPGQREPDRLAAAALNKILTQNSKTQPGSFLKPQLRRLRPVTLKNRTLNPIAGLFIEHAREVAKPLAKKK